jgi:hypothetical protein
MSLGRFEVRDKKLTIRTSIRIGRNMVVWNIEIGKSLSLEILEGIPAFMDDGRRGGRGSYGTICNFNNEVSVE